MSADKFLKTGTDDTAAAPADEHAVEKPAPRSYEMPVEAEVLHELVEERKELVRILLRRAQEIVALLEQKKNIKWQTMKTYLHTLALIATHQHRNDYQSFGKRRDRRRLENAQDALIVQADPEFLFQLETLLQLRSCELEDWIKGEVEHITLDEKTFRFLYACMRELHGDLEAYPKPEPEPTNAPAPSAMQTMANERVLDVPERGEGQAKTPPPPPTERYDGDWE